MIIYPELISIKINDLHKLEKFKHYFNKITYFYSDEGIYLLKNNIIKKLIINDSIEIIKKKIDNYSFICDKSEILYSENLFKLPFNYIKDIKEENSYIITPNLKLVIENTQKNITNFYFDLSDNIISEIIKLEIKKIMDILH